MRRDGKALSRNNFSNLLREMQYTQAFPEARVQMGLIALALRIWGFGENILRKLKQKFCCIVFGSVLY